ncbi:MAG: hypothetical protein ABMA00_20585 [Gemmatimonas sp.]
MIFADVLKYVFLVLGALLVFISYWLAAAALVPGLVDHAREEYGVRPIRITILGLVMGLPLVIAGLGIAKVAPAGGVKLIGAALAAIPLLMGLVGSAGLSERIGHGLVHGDDARSPWRRSLRGAVVLSVTFLLPFVGWFAVMPLVLFSGVGASLLALSARRRARRIAIASQS